MTTEQRNNIFAKECLTIEDIMLLYEPISYSAAEKLMLDIKRKGDRLHIRGRVHIQDYLEYFGLTERRYASEAEQAPTVATKPVEPPQERQEPQQLFRSKDYSATTTRQTRRSRSRYQNLRRRCK